MVTQCTLYIEPASVCDSTPCTSSLNGQVTHYSRLLLGIRSLFSTLTSAEASPPISRVNMPASCVGQGAFNLVRTVYVWFHCRASQPIQCKHASVMWDKGSLVCVGQGAFNLVTTVYVWFHCRASQPIQCKHAAVMWDKGSLVCVGQGAFNLVRTVYVWFHCRGMHARYCHQTLAGTIYNVHCVTMHR